MCNNISNAIPSPSARNSTRNWEGLDLYSHYNRKIGANLETKKVSYSAMERYVKQRRMLTISIYEKLPFETTPWMRKSTG